MLKIQKYKTCFMQNIYIICDQYAFSVFNELFYQQY